MATDENKPQLPRCEKCNSRLIAQSDKNRLWCQVCGMVRTDAEALKLMRDYLDGGGIDASTNEYVPTVRINGPTDAELVYLEAAWKSICQKDLKTARYICNQALQENPNLIDAYYLLFLAAENEDRKYYYLGSILAFDPYHERANFEMAKMRGVLASQLDFETAKKQRIVPEKSPEMAAKATTEQCPMCGGHTLYVADEMVKCRSCGHVLGKRNSGQKNYFHNLQDALIQRKYGLLKEWNVGKRTLQCQNCGAQLTLSGSIMTQQCTFCDSQHVIIRDTAGTFQEPDAILPAKLDRQRAEALMQQSAPLDIKDCIQSTQLMGVFLPFWCFRGAVEVATLENGSIGSELVTIDNVLVAGANEPGQATIEDLQPYTLDHLIPYDPQYLAQWSAGLYTQDMIQASITANAFVKYVAIEMLNRTTRFDPAPFARTDKDYPLQNSALMPTRRAKLVGALEYSFLLLPAWMITLFLEGGGFYHGVVNGQTGEVIFTRRVDSKGGYRARRERLPEESVIKPITPRY